MDVSALVHGGPDALGVPPHDFSTNANAVGPCPDALGAVLGADRSRYPDPAYTDLRAQLAAFHGVAPARIVPSASASECIHRITAWAHGLGMRDVLLPAHGYGDYGRAAALYGMNSSAPVHRGPTLHWACEPGSPLGMADEALALWHGVPIAPGDLRVLDCAYAPLRLDGVACPAPASAWQIWTPNKALGLTGVRAAYAIAPAGHEAQASALMARAPSWPLGAEGVALLSAWVRPEVQQWLQDSLATLREWKRLQLGLCAQLGWEPVPGSLANYFCARLPTGHAPTLARLRAQGIKLRDCTSFGLPGHVRMGVLAPQHQQALARGIVVP